MEHDAEPAHRAVHHVAGHRRSRGSPEGGGTGSGWRIRQQDPADPGRLRHRVLRDEARASGEVDRDALGELPVDDPRPRSRAGRGARRHEGRSSARPALPGLGGYGRVSVDRRTGHPDHPARIDAVGPVPDAGRQGRRIRRLHEHHAGRGISRGRASGSDVHARAADGRPRTRAGHRSRGGSASPD
jgi:hypothetical protein